VSVIWVLRWSGPARTLGSSGYSLVSARLGVELGTRGVVPPLIHVNGALPLAR